MPHSFSVGDNKSGRHSEAFHLRFQRVRNQDIIDEGEVMRNIFPILCGGADIPTKQNLSFIRLKSITNGKTAARRPDFYDGALLEDLDSRVRQDLGPFIIPTKHQSAPVAPNFFTEAKVPQEGVDEALRQALGDGMLGARAMHKLQSYGQDELIFDNNTYSLTSTYHDSNLKMSAIHVTPSGPDSSLEYYMNEIGGWDLTGDLTTCRRGLAAFRNGRDWARKQRHRFISAANETAKSMTSEQLPFTPGGQDNSFITEEEEDEQEGGEKKED